MSPSPLNHADLSVAVRLGPIVAIDLIIRDESDRVLLGFRTNEPAKGVYFVPGGRIWKDERISDAFERILKAETGTPPHSTKLASGECTSISLIQTDLMSLATEHTASHFSMRLELEPTHSLELTNSIPNLYGGQSQPF